MPGHVPNDEQGGAVGLEERVIEVAADQRMRAGGPVADGDLQAVRLRRRGEQAALQGLGDLKLPAVEAGVVQRQRAAAGRLDRGGDLHLGVRRPRTGVHQRQRPERLAAGAQRHDRAAGRAQPLPRRPQLLGGQRRRDPLLVDRGHLHRLAGQQRIHHRGVVAGAAQPPGHVSGQVDAAGRIPVCPGLLPRPAVLADQHDDRPVRQPPHHQLGQLAGRLAAIQGGDQRLADLGEEAQPVVVGVLADRLGGALGGEVGGLAEAGLQQVVDELGRR